MKGNINLSRDSGNEGNSLWAKKKEKKKKKQYTQQFAEQPRPPGWIWCFARDVCTSAAVKRASAQIPRCNNLFPQLIDVILKFTEVQTCVLFLQLQPERGVRVHDACRRMLPPSGNTPLLHLPLARPVFHSQTSNTTNNLYLMKQNSLGSTQIIPCCWSEKHLPAGSFCFPDWRAWQPVAFSNLDGHISHKSQHTSTSQCISTRKVPTVKTASGFFQGWSLIRGFVGWRSICVDRILRGYQGNTPTWVCCIYFSIF